MFADLLLRKGTVITVDKKDSVVDAVAIKGNKILFAGTTEDANAFINESTTVVDLHGRTVTPGFIDSHIHSAVMGVNALAIDCRPSVISSISDLQESIYERAKVTPEGQWIRGWGYNDQYLKERRHPNKWDLDKVAQNHPVMLIRVCNHISVYNSAAINLAGITNTSDFSPLTFTRKDNEISGIMKEEAHFHMFKAAMLKKQEIIDGMEMAYDMLIKEGITSIHDSGGYGPAQFEAFQQAIAREKFKIRLYAMVFSFAENLQLNDDFLKIGIHSGLGNSHYKIGPLKLMIDGSSSGPTASTIAPYHCDPSNHGILTHPQHVVDDYIARGHQHGWQVTSHAIGDNGVTIIVNAIEKAMKEFPMENTRHRIEHCAMVTDELLSRIKKLNIVPISNPIFLYEFGDGYMTNYGKENAYRMFTCKSFFDHGIIAAGASDCPITFSNPLMGIHLAVNRETQGGQTINPDERITPLEALRMYTYNGAYASKEEKTKGSIEQGKLADLVVLNQDFLKAEPSKLRDIQVDMTILDGQIVYQR